MANLKTIDFPDDITQQDLKDWADVLAQYINEKLPNVETKVGSAFYNIVLKGAALMVTLYKYQLEKASESFTLLDNTDEDQIEALLANLFIERNQGTKARGIATVLLKDDRTTTIPATSTFSSGQLNFNPIQNYTYTRGNDKLIVVEIIAEATGSKYNIEAETSLTSSHSNIQSVTVVNDISSGSDEENITDTVARAKSSFSTRGFYNKRSIEATLKEEFSNIFNISSHGFGDKYLERDLSQLGVHVGSMIDIYVRNSKDRYIKKVEATVSSNTIELSDLTYPPYLNIESIVISGNTITDFSIERSVIETYHTIADPRLTCFEKIKIILPTSDYDTQTASITFWTADIKTMQDYVDSNEVRNLLADVLVKNPIPYAVDVTCDIYSSTGEYDDSSIKSIIIECINSMNSGIYNANKIVNELYSIGIDVNKIISIVKSYDENFVENKETVSETYKDYEDPRISFYAGNISIIKKY